MGYTVFWQLAKLSWRLVQLAAERGGNSGSSSPAAH